MGGKMSNLIVIRIVPQAPLDPETFSNYLSALGGLQITAFDLSFNSPTSGQNVGTATFIAPTTPPFPLASIANPLPGFVTIPAQYPAGITNGIIQQYDLVAGPTPPVTIPPTTQSPFYQLESVATAVIEIPSPPPGQTVFENLSLQMSWGSGAGSQSIPVALEYYDVALALGPTPDPNVTSWASLSPSLYLTLPAPPTSAGATPFTLPSDGTVPPFDALLGAVNAVLNVDPGPATTATTNGTTAIG